MSLYLGNSKIGNIYLGSTKIYRMYKGSTLIYTGTPKAQIVFEFSSSAFTPTNSLLGYSATVGNPVWEHISGAQWKLTVDLYDKAGGDNDNSIGIGRLCTTKNDVATMTLSKTGNVTAEIISITGADIETLDRAFTGCNAITGFKSAVSSISSLSSLYNVNQLFDNCTGVIDDSALSLYTALSQVASITNHSGTFTNCGPAAYLSQIPAGWGGTQVPPSTLMTSSRTNALGTYSTWEITGNAPDWTNIIGLYLFTEASVSTYAGVSMNRSRITKKNGLGTTQGTDALYFYPAFAQYTGSSSSNRVITWVATTDTPNGSLTISQGNTDMPGTMDYSTYGPISMTYGTYDSNVSVDFLFLVTNVPIANWTGLSDAYGVLYNSNFKTDGGFRYFY